MHEIDTPPDRWQRLQAILDAALARPAGEWADYVDEACRHDADLRREVVELLTLSGEADAFFGATPVPPLPALEAALRTGDEASMAGRAVGPYRLVREIGRGGMGTVYLAERDDAHFRKTVAVKLVKRGMDTDEVVRRFVAERQILASLDHPNIARLYDGGVTDDGLPYFVMEYVEGVPLTDYCDAHRLPVAERLRLFRVACDAVHHAHRNLVIHCDLKPTNILVTAGGEVKLLDFGIARVLRPGGRDATVLTLPPSRYVTPEFAAPEQLRGEALTTETDVYALGVLLYVLLAGHRPFRLKGQGPAELERTICEVPPPRPSTRVLRPGDEATPDAVAAARATTARRLSRQLAGDLDNIVAMALRKDPAARYHSPARLADDVGRYLEGRPVLACPDAALYRAAKFVRRHALAVGLATVAVLSMLTGLVAATWQAHVAAQERDRAHQAAEEAQQVAAFLVGLFEEIDPSTDRGSATTARELLDRGAAKAESTLAGQPEVQATLLDAIGRVYRSLGLFDDAGPLLEQALAIRRATFGPEHAAVAESIHNLGYFKFSAGDYAGADVLFVEAARQRRLLLGGNDLELANGLGDRAVLLRRLGRYDEAEATIREALAIYRRSLGDDNDYVAAGLVNLAGILTKKEAFAEAETALREALDLYCRHLGADHLYVGVTLGNLGAALIAQGKYAAAGPVVDASLDLYRRNLPEDHPWMAHAVYLQGRLYYERGDPAAARRPLEAALALRRQTLPADHPDLAESLVLLGRVVAEADPEAALPLLREGLAVRERALGPETPPAAEARGLVGEALTRLGRYAEAEPLLLAAYGGLDPAERQLRADARARLAALYDAWGRSGQAKPYREAGVE